MHHQAQQMFSVKDRSQNLDPKHFEPRAETEHDPESEKEKEKKNQIQLPTAILMTGSP